MIRAAIERTDLSDFADIEKDVLAGDQLLWLAVSIMSRPRRPRI
jgi:hypothetical protein